MKNVLVSLIVAAALTAFSSSVVFAQTGGVTAVNVSARANVSTGENVLVGGFILVGTASKIVLVRALGPSLNVNGTILFGVLQDPVLELHDSSGGTVTSNDDWQSDPEAALIGNTLPPPDPRESATVVSLVPGSYTVIVHGKGASTGVALVELYDLDQLSSSRVGNLSTRGNVQVGEAAMIGGFIISGNSAVRTLIRTLGPELLARGLPNVLQDTTLELRDGEGALIGFNDDWTMDQEAEIFFSDLAPTDLRESALVETLPPGPYTVIVRGKNQTVGIALLEVYLLQ